MLSDILVPFRRAPTETFAQLKHRNDLDVRKFYSADLSHRLFSL
jgi:hypothetical protein